MFHTESVHARIKRGKGWHHNWGNFKGDGVSEKRAWEKAAAIFGQRRGKEPRVEDDFRPI